MEKHPPITINRQRDRQKNVLFLSFCPDFFASPGQGGAAFEGGRDEAGPTQLHSIALNQTKK
jgi:hypothetical protein